MCFDKAIILLIHIAFYFQLIESYIKYAIFIENIIELYFLQNCLLMALPSCRLATVSLISIHQGNLYYRLR